MIELLLVISIITLLVALVLPSMVGALRSGQRVACTATLRSVATGMAAYALMSQGSIIGAPSCSGGYLAGAPVAWGPAVQRWDFLGPMAWMWEFGLTMGSGGEGEVIQRFNALRSHKAFLCPGNKFLSFHYSGPDAGAGRMVSYNTVRYQLWREEEVPGSHAEKLPRHWRPSIHRIGRPEKKVFCGDGARYSSIYQPPDYDLTVEGPNGGAFSDTGAYKLWTRSWDRSRAPGNGYTGGVDARMYAFRHSTAEPPVGAPGNAYKLNLAFYDGHVATLGDLEASNPHLWLPKGTVLLDAPNVVWPDAVEHFGITGDLLIGG